MNEQKIIK